MVSTEGVSEVSLGSTETPSDSAGAVTDNSTSECNKSSTEVVAESPTSASAKKEKTFKPISPKSTSRSSITTPKKKQLSINTSIATTTTPSKEQSGFASSSPRFQSPKNFTPGPGSYDAHAAIDKLSPKKNGRTPSFTGGNHLASSSFRSSTPRLKDPKPIGPAPGAYDVGDSFSPLLKAKNKGGASFKDTSKRFAEPKFTTPSPAAYNPVDLNKLSTPRKKKST